MRKRWAAAAKIEAWGYRAMSHDYHTWFYSTETRVGSNTVGKLGHWLQNQPSTRKSRGHKRDRKQPTTGIYTRLRDYAQTDIYPEDRSRASANSAAYA